MRIELRDPNIIMKLSRLGSFHQSKLSFLRSFLSEFKDWDYSRNLFNLDQNGFGEAVYSFKKKDRVYSLVCFANEIKDDERSDRVIATKWDAAFTLHDGVPSKNDIERLKHTNCTERGPNMEGIIHALPFSLPFSTVFNIV
mgnify:CR=1 FL=1